MKEKKPDSRKAYVRDETSNSMRPGFIIYDYENEEMRYALKDPEILGIGEKFFDVFSKNKDFKPMAEVEEVYSFGEKKMSIVSKESQGFGMVLVSSLGPDDARSYLDDIMHKPHDTKKILKRAESSGKELSKNDFRERVLPVLEYDFSGGEPEVRLLDPTYSGSNGIRELGIMSYYSAPLYAYDILRAFFGKDTLIVTSEKVEFSLGKLLSRLVDSDFFDHLTLPATFYHVIDLENMSGTVFKQGCSGKRLSYYLKGRKP